MKISDKEKILQIIKENSLNSFLATCDGDQPTLRPMAPIVEDDFSIWLITFKSSRKIKHIINNPKISLSFYDGHNFVKNAIIFGKAVIIEEKDIKLRLWNLRKNSLYKYFPDGSESAEFCILKVIIEKIEWNDEGIKKRKIFRI